MSHAGRVLPWQSKGFRRLMSLFLINGVASAIPATLVLFFIQDKLQALALAPLFLGSYFLSAAASVPWWVKRMKRHGLMPSWALGMGLSVLAFVGVIGPLWMGPITQLGLAALELLTLPLTALLN